MVVSFIIVAEGVIVTKISEEFDTYDPDGFSGNPSFSFSYNLQAIVHILAPQCYRQQVTVPRIYEPFVDR